MRIVSLLPSATEIICALGLGDQLVGITHECDHPSFVASLPRVTRSLITNDLPSAVIDRTVREHMRVRNALYTLDLPVLQRLAPDLIVTQALCDVCAVAEDEVREAACSLPGLPRVVNLEPTTFAQVLQSLHTVAEAAGCPENATDTLAALRERVARVKQRGMQQVHRPRVVVLEWIDPPFSCGHWSPELVGMAGGIEVLGKAGERSRQVNWEEVVAAQPEVMILACCGFNIERTLADLPILRGNLGWEQLPCVRAGQVYAVDGSAYFSRPGPRLVDSLEILAHALFPEGYPLPTGAELVKVSA